MLPGSSMPPVGNTSEPDRQTTPSSSMPSQKSGTEYVNIENDVDADVERAPAPPPGVDPEQDPDHHRQPPSPCRRAGPSARSPRRISVVTGRRLRSETPRLPCSRLAARRRQNCSSFDSVEVELLAQRLDLRSATGCGRGTCSPVGSSLTTRNRKKLNTSDERRASPMRAGDLADDESRSHGGLLALVTRSCDSRTTRQTAAADHDDCRRRRSRSARPC